MPNLWKEVRHMQITDAIADMLTRIRNAGSAKHESVDIPASNIKKDIARYYWMRVMLKMLNL
jgi:ribosomal protein S8